MSKPDPQMSKTLLLTSFTTWRQQQRSNSSDDLLLEILKINPPSSFHFLRQLPVDFDLAPAQAIAKVDQLQPEVVICCGMAEDRTLLNVESRAVGTSEVLYCKPDLDALIEGLAHTEVSNDAGQFVCNWLYYSMLKHFQTSHSVCIFVHVPVLTDENRAAIAADFRCILERISQPTYSVSVAQEARLM